MSRSVHASPSLVETNNESHWRNTENFSNFCIYSFKFCIMEFIFIIFFYSEFINFSFTCHLHTDACLYSLSYFSRHTYIVSGTFFSWIRRRVTYHCAKRGKKGLVQLNPPTPDRASNLMKHKVLIRWIYIHSIMYTAHMLEKSLFLCSLAKLQCSRIHGVWFTNSAPSSSTRQSLGMEGTRNTRPPTA